MGMKETEESHGIKRLGSYLTSLGIVILFGAVLSMYGAQEKKDTSTIGVTGRAPTEAAPDSVEEADRPVLQRRNPRYQLRRGDTFDLNFPFTPEFNQTATVYPDGYITLTGLGDLYIAGKSVPQLRESVKTAYAKILHDPVINVVLRDFEKPYFIAGGEVGHPGKFDLRDDTTLSQAIAIAGGFNESSKHSQVLLFRRVSKDWVEVKVINVKKMFQARNLTEDPHLQPEDMFFVPQNFISKIKKWIPYTSVSTGINPALL
jgi:polysaccharide export outer membrane protein